MIKKLKYIVFLILTFLISSTFITTSFATDTSTLSTYSPACILMETSSGKILYEKNSNQVRYPASTTKIMTAILVLENCKLTDISTVSRNAIHSIPPDYVMCNIKEGEELTIEQLLNVLLIPSANDAAVVLAEHVAGSVSKFSDLMNEKAKEIGCKNTHFVNPNGIHNKNHVSTAYDLALIGQYAMKNNTFRKIVKKTQYTLPATNKYSKTDRTFKTTNDLLIKNTSTAKSNYYYPNATGVKTGYTGEAGNCLVAAAKKDNMEVISVVLGADFTKEGLSEKFLDSIALLDYAFDHYAIEILQEKNSVLQEVEVSSATEETKNLKVLVKDNIETLIEKNASTETLNPEISIDKLKAPISSGIKIGTITYTIDGKSYSSDLIAGNDVLPSNTLSLLLHIGLIIVTLYLLFTLLKPKKNSKSRGHSSKNSKTCKHKKSRKASGKHLYTLINNFE
ncbi:MAG: D-alanyl-D-alanine carboxypeptidase [Clostridia bacterium]|jgi:D-alanyl-D-alanine carboxypeptidase (penicillin-binding protein 5/6)|nr:D-alanyl-D-alanine carboxypeptidase [Clostridia bacterium]